MSDLPENERAGLPGGVLQAGSTDAMSPGTRLATERRAHGLTIEQIASQLNLAPRQIAALEADDYAALPGMVIVRGFLRAYAKLLKIDPVPLLAVLIDKNSPASAVPMRHALSASFSESRLPSLTGTGVRSMSLPVAASVVVLVAAGVATYALGWWPESLSRKVGQFRSGSVTGGGAVEPPPAAASGTADTSVLDAPAPAPSQTNAVPGGSGSTDGVGGDVALPLQSSVLPASSRVLGTFPATPPASTSAPVKVVPQPALPASIGSPPARGAVPAAATDTTSLVNALVLHVRDDSWVEIKRADNTAVIGKIVKSGSVETFDVSEPVTVTIGNIAGVEASLRGAPLDLSSAATGNVARLRLK